MCVNSGVTLNLHYADTFCVNATPRVGLIDLRDVINNATDLFCNVHHVVLIVIIAPPPQGFYDATSSIFYPVHLQAETLSHECTYISR